jgi:general secretion pathway protein D
VPCLGALPLVGYLFRADRKQHTKTNLLIFITPHILKDTGDMHQATERYQQRIPAPEEAGNGAAAMFQPEQ